jgi:mRNA-degrading endonuclease RelE of RelBE toxin-antitoxin system
MAYQIELAELAVRELKAIRAFDRRRIVDELKRQLAQEPSVATRNRKLLEAVSPGFEHVPPIWQLRVGDYRVFYDVDEDAQTVYVRAVRLKEPHQTTEEIAR